MLCNIMKIFQLYGSDGRKRRQEYKRGGFFDFSMSKLFEGTVLPHFFKKLFEILT